MSITSNDDDDDNDDGSSFIFRNSHCGENNMYVRMHGKESKRQRSAKKIREKESERDRK